MSEAIVETPTTSQAQPHWLDQPVSRMLRLDWEKALYILFFVLAVLSRFWDLGARAISHDESLHANYSWELYRGMGFSHSPLMHGPLRFHLNAFFFALFGADDFTVRIPPALFGVGLVMLPILLRPWLGRRGALATSFFLLISPAILYHQRYIRDEPFMAFYGTLMFWIILSYFRDRRTRWLYGAAVVMALMYTTMEAAFIYVAIFGAFAAFAGIFEVAQEAGWGRQGVGGTLLGVGAAIGVFFAAMILGARVLRILQPVVPADGSAIGFGQLLPSLLFSAIAGLLIGGGAFFVLRALIPAAARRSAGFNLAIVLGGLSLLMLSASALALFNHGAQYVRVGDNYQVDAAAGTTTVWGVISGEGTTAYVDPIFFAGGSFPTDPANTINVLRLVFLFACFAGLALGMGLWWDPFKWMVALGAFGGIGVVFFTTMFTNGLGLGTGFVGSLGYWLAQHGVRRADQPGGYYLLIGAVYEYLPMILALVALVYFGWRIARGRSTASLYNGTDRSTELAVPMLMLWSVAAWIAFTVAGEKMPWLIVHIALPMVLLGGRLAGELFDRIDWRGVWLRREWLYLILLPIFFGSLLAIAGGIGQLSAAAQQGAASPTLNQLNAIGSLLSGVLIAGGALAGLIWLAKRSLPAAMLQMGALVGLGILSLMTIRTAWMYNYVNYDNVAEFGMYAHGGPGLKIALREIEELSRKLTGSPTQIEVLYDSDATWPWQWYLRDFPNKRYIAGTPTRADASLPVLILSGNNWSSVDQAVGDNYDWFRFERIWWPMEDYKNLPGVLCPAQVEQPDGTVLRYEAYDENGDGKIDETEQANGDARCWGYVSTIMPRLLPGLWDIFFFRDYTKYGELTGQKFAQPDWPLHDDFRLYIRKDLAAKVWDQAIGSVGAGGVETVPEPARSDPYQARWQDLAALRTFGAAGQGDGQFTVPHGIDIAPDGSIYVADSNNHRIVKLDRSGEFLLAFGTWSGEPPNGDFLNPSWRPPDGTFIEPWDVAAGPDGSVYVADTWNSRVQKFDANGKHLKTWGYFNDTGGDASGAEGLFWGPRGIDVGDDGRVYVADTGNKRVQVFDADGAFLFQFGGAGLLDGNLDEPVGIAVSNGEVFVADTWNGRVQVFSAADGQALRRWDIAGWYDPNLPDLGRDKVGKPYLGAGEDGRVYVADQTGNRILVFESSGAYVTAFGRFSQDEFGFSAPSGIEVDEDGNILVVDTGNHRVLVFPPPLEPEEEPAEN